jgi:hypothetical protein
MAFIYSLTDTWNDAGVTFTAIRMNVTDNASNAASLLMDLQVGGLSAFRVSKAGSPLASGVFTLQVAATDTNRMAIINNNGVAIRQNATFGWGGAGDAGGAPVLMLAFDAANTLAQRNGTNAQTLRVYGTFTDASNYTRLAVNTTATTVTIQTERAGTGGFGSLVLGSNAGASLNMGSNITHTANQNIFANGSIIINAGANPNIEMVEVTAPAAPATNGVRIYAEDNGSGKTRLMARFATGAAVQIAIEP